MCYAMHNVAKWCEGSFEIKNILFSSDQSQTTLSQFTPLYLKAFYQQYSSKLQIFHKLLYNVYTGYRCSKAGCEKVLVVDGNLKNYRAVCAATDAGYIEYCGLPGSIKSGCTNTPSQKSRFCQVHKPRSLVSPGESSSRVIEMILEKKTLRSQNLYTVCNFCKSLTVLASFPWIGSVLGKEECDVSCVKEDEIPKSVLEEFKDNSLVEI